MALAFALVAGLALQARAQLVTYAWRVSVPGASENGIVFPHLAFDHSGNFYTVFVQPNQVFLRKYSPAENLLFNVLVATPTTPPNDAFVYIHTTPNGVNEFEDVITSVPDGSGNEVTNVYRFDTSGNPLFSGAKTFTNITGGDYLYNYAFDPPGNAYVDLLDVVGSNGQIKLASIAPNGTVGASQPIITDFMPLGISSAFVQGNGAHPFAWVLAGFDSATNKARCTAYDALNAVTIFNTPIPTPPAGQNINVFASPLSLAEWALVEDDVNAQTGASTFMIMGMSGLGATNWTYPASGTASGYIFNVKPGVHFSDYYAGTTDNSNSATPQYGKLDFQHVQAWQKYTPKIPSFDMFPSATQDEFLLTGAGSFSTFVQHGNANGDLDWGRSFPNATYTPQVGWFQNAFYMVTGLVGPSVEFDRLVTGPALLNVAVPGTLASGASGTITVTLNAAAPAGGTKVSLTSYTGLVSFPGSGQSTVVTIPAGQTMISVPIQATTSSSGGTERGVVIQNGVRWNYQINVTGS